MFIFTKSFLSRVIRGILQGKTLFFIFIFLSSFLYATIINVSAGESIQDGITAAANGDTVLVAEGTYYENINYNGKLITVSSLFLTTQDTTYISTTIINGNSSGSVVTFESGEDSTAVLCGFTLTNGSNLYGGGIYCEYSSPSLQNVTITGNSAGFNGGGIRCDYSNPSLENVIITGNSAHNGGGIWCGGSSPSLDNVTISGNSAPYGGGIYCKINSSPSITNSILWNDTTSEIFFQASGDPNSITVSYSDIQGGEAGIVTNNNGIVYWLDGNIDEDPLFVDPANGDYHLQSTSPCIDAGDSASPLDPDGTIVDMGAYYYDQILNPIPPIADFTADTTNIYLPLTTVNFTDLSTPGTGVIDEWYWEFGDGNNSSLQYPANEYLLLGNYTVSLTVTDVNDSTDMETKVDYITVNPPTYNGPVWHISTTGSNVWGNGSSQYPFATIQHGINASSNTDTILVQSGTYVENINYNGELITVASWFLTTQDTTYISTTIIDGNSIGSVVTFENGEDSTAVLTGFTITNGSAVWPGGGGISCTYASTPSLENLTITGNSAEYGGGISCTLGSSSSLVNIIITNNSASGTYGYGGGIYCFNCSNPGLQNVTISGNSASSGGGIYCDNSTPVLINSILWNDSPQEIYIESGSVTATYSDIQGGWAGTGNIDSDPLFVDPANGDYHLQSNSPCIDAGDPAFPLDPDGTIADMGAYYYDQILNPIPPIADFTADTTNIYLPLTTVNFTDLSTPGTGVIDEWYWEFGDGNNSSLQYPANEYLLLGNYTVSLTVTDVNDSTDMETKVDYITVNPPTYNGPVWHISTTGSNVWGNGSSQYPFATIQHGINASSNTDTILVQSGTYVENINYNGELITVASWFLTTQDTTYISTTIIDGNSIGSVVTFENGEDSTAVLTGFTITNGSAVWPGGGGISCTYASTPSLENLTITGNSAEYGGGISCTLGSSSNLVNIIITNNSASGTYGYGGGIYCFNCSNPGLQNVTISGNSANYGGGIYCYSNASPSLINSILWNDSPQEIYIESGSVTATYSDIQGGWTGTGNIDSDPLFVDSGSGNYHLQSTSPCIDAGDPASPLDPDGTVADMGAYYYDQILHPFPPIADFTVDVTSGYLPLTVNLTDLSTQGSGIIDEWYWDFGDGNNSTLHNPAHEYLLPGIHTISLTVTDVNDSTDTETKIDYITVYSTDPPAPPTDVQVNISGEDAIITWTAVDTTIYGDPTIIDGYVVYFNEMPDDEHFWFLAFTANTVHTHEFVAQFSEQMFYNVVAYVDLGEDELNYLKEMNNSTRKVSKLEVRKELSRMRKR